MIPVFDSINLVWGVPLSGSKLINLDFTEHPANTISIFCSRLLREIFYFAISKLFWFGSNAMTFDALFTAK